MDYIQRENPNGKPIFLSLYRIHFGDFAGIGTQWLYFALGMMLTVISASGMDIWLGKRKRRDVLNSLWPAFVWGSTVAFSVSALASPFPPDFSRLSFWLTQLAVLAVATRWEPAVVGRRLRIALSVVLGCLLITCLWRHGQATANSAAGPINLALLLAAILFPGQGLWRRRAQGQELAVARAD